MPTFSEPSLPPFFEQQQLSIGALKQSGLPLEETTYLTIGGGIGSFIWADHLVIHGVDPATIVALGLEARPYARLRRLCRNSQIFEHDRLRSDSGGTPDNIWGWPGYALREMGRDLRRGRARQAARLAWQIFSEPVLHHPFTPQAGDVFTSLDREARRIGWSSIRRFGLAQAVRKTNDGRYVVAYSPTMALKGSCRLILARYVHLAVGYPGVRVLPELDRYRQQRDYRRHFVNAYEPHAHVYRRLRQTGGTVILRGRGITASRIIHRLHQERERNPNIRILHLMQTPKPHGPRYYYARRLTQNHFDHQPYNFPKACFGGDLRRVMERADDQERAGLVGLWGGTTTAKRPLWERIITTGLNEGWYQIRFGRLARVEPAQNGLTVVVRGDAAWLEEITLRADFIIDATGLEIAPERSPLWRDLRQCYRLPKNQVGQIRVTNHFEVAGLRNLTGRVYAGGIMILGGPFAPVDSFTGLQYAAQKSVESLIAQGAPGVRRLGPVRSVGQWTRWAAGVSP
ncbi:MAG: hypothetical protein H6632_10600 [Anaerolineales bacterium]|nr:hypothetical protein [Anaerolineales bacterium]